MNNDDKIEESERLVQECRRLICELETLLAGQENRGDLARYKRIMEELRRDNERLYRENIMLRSSLM